MRSGLYEAVLCHRRLGRRPHAFRYRLHLVHLDLAELEVVFRGRWLWSLEGPNVVSFRRRDFHGDPGRPLREAVLDRVEASLGRRPAGAVELVGQLRTLGYLFNPLVLYLCRDGAGALDAVVGEITNTPWGERHAYVLDAVGSRGRPFVRRFPKEFHVSPFFGLEQVYEWRLADPGDELAIGMRNLEGGEPVFEAELTGRRRPLSARSLAAALLRHPLQPLRLHAAIYLQAALLWAKRTPFFVHPSKRAVHAP